jgi:hypothetical protein
MDLLFGKEEVPIMKFYWRIRVGSYQLRPLGEKTHDSES